MIISRSVARPVNLYKSQVSASQEGNPIGTGGNGSGEARVDVEIVASNVHQLNCVHDLGMSSYPRSISGKYQYTHVTYCDMIYQ